MHSRKKLSAQTHPPVALSPQVLLHSLMEVRGMVLLHTLMEVRGLVLLHSLMEVRTTGG